MTDLGTFNFSRCKGYTFNHFLNDLSNSKNLKEIYANHQKTLISFYNFCKKHGLQITKEKFLDEYNSGTSLKEIAKKYSIPYDYIGFIRELYEAKVKGARFQKRLKNEQPLSQVQKDVIVGGLLGDAGRVNKTTYNIKFKQSIKQKPYLDYKYNLLKDICTPRGIKFENIFDARYNANYSSYNFLTKTHNFTKHILDLLYCNNKKHISKDFLTYVTPRAIAIWYMDDGTIDFKISKMQSRPSKNFRPEIKFCTDNFDEQSVDELVDFFSQYYNINTRKIRHNQNKLRLAIDTKSQNDFIKLIRPYIIKEMMYKIDLDKNLERKNIALSAECFLTKPIEFKKAPCEKKRQAIVDEYISYFREKGLQCILPTHKKIDINYFKQYDAQKIIHDDCIGFANQKSSELISYFQHFWRSKAKNRKSIADLFEDDTVLDEVVRECLEEEKHPLKHSLTKLKSFRSTKPPSVFMPCVAKAVFEKYCTKNSRVLDFHCGYGGRLVGAISCKKVISYVGCDVNELTVEGCRNIIRDAKDKTSQVYAQDATDFLYSLENQAFDFCFTSPPYFNAEEYEDNTRQSFKKYTVYHDWLKNFLFLNIDQALKISRLVAINIENVGPYKIADDLIDHYQRRIKEIFKLRMPKLAGKVKYERLIVLS